MRRLHSVLAAALFLLAMAAPLAMAEEVISEFASFVDIRPDGSLLVREDITATSEGDKIRRGIYRDFPLKYSGQEKEYKGLVPFEVVSVSLDGKELNSKDVEKRGDVMRVYMRGDKPLSKGEHRFVLEYSTSLHLRYFEKHDELNWNATGAGWAFKILRASCLISAPENVPIDRAAGWLGRSGTKNDKTMLISRPAPNQVLFQGLAGGRPVPVNPGDELTVAVSFPKGLFANPMISIMEDQKRKDEEKQKSDAEDEMRRREAAARQKASDEYYDAQREASPLMDFLYSISGVILMQSPPLLLVLGWFGLAWYFKGRDPAKGTIIPRFHPPVADYMGKPPKPAAFRPAPMSPAAMEYLLKHNSMSSRGFAATLIALAAHGLCTIKKGADGLYSIAARGDSAFDPARLSPEEQAVYAKLSEETGQGREELRMRPYMPAMRSIESAALERLRDNYSRAWTRNIRYVLIGWLLILPLGLAWSMQPLAELFHFSGGEISHVLLMCPVITIFMSASILFLCNGSIIPALFMIPFWGVGIYVLYDEGYLGFFSFAPTIMLIAACVFSFQMKAPSKAARQALDEIEGLRMYVDTAEKNRLEALNRPEDTPEVFQRLLPYAVVLGLEKVWCDYFTAQAGAAALLAGSGLELDSGGDSDFTSFVNEFSEAASSAAASEPSASRDDSDSAFSSDGGGSGSGSGGGGGGGC